ncbi:hypothetical protein [Paraburkholderia saeva]|uniref:Uncharacterized protein n=1 Tax=Paraburkholderia saeva TaxID=2777537 RepID=A0A9N8S0C0_9BURK|nr:hypothetical protein [Paraburkholderia saeva]CAG4889945.1 hypothetical protein R70241_00864 [Paraburkholderia saeva]CAG4912869.1 hypothetical protein LMG31841_04213 [Paraburkholderia saeva]
MSKLTSTIRHGVAEILPPTLFFFVILQIVANVISLLTRGSVIPLPTFFSVSVAALILGKSVLLANMLPFINRFPDKPLIWNAGWKTAIYTLVALLVRFLEHLYDYWKAGSGLTAANHKLLLDLNWPHFWAVQILLVTLIVNYCVMAELARLIGRDKLLAMFFGPVPWKSTGQAAG